MTERALVVGGTGFLGKHVCDALAAAGWDTVIASRRPGAGAVVLDAERSIRAELADALTRLEPALVVNAVGLIWRNDPPAMVVANTVVPEQIAMAMADAEYRGRLVHLGSCLEYGPVSPPEAIDELTPLKPESAYGRSKLAGTRRLEAATRAYQLDVVLLRVFNAVGAGMDPASVLGGTVQTLLRAQHDGTCARIDLLDLRQHRDYVDARDVADAVLAAAELPHSTGIRVFNIGSAVARTAHEVVHLLADTSGVAYRISIVPVAAGTARSTGASWQLADTRRALEVMGWSANRSITDTVHYIWTAAKGEPS